LTTTQWVISVCFHQSYRETIILTAKGNANDDRCQFDAALERQFEERQKGGDYIEEAVVGC